MENGLNGFKDWFKRIARTAVRALSTYIDAQSFGLLHETISGITESLENYINDLRQGAVADPTIQEQAIINSWMSRKFTPYFNNLLRQGEDAFTVEGLNFQKAKINLVLAKCSIIREYYLLNETAGLSQNAIDSRSDLIELFLSKLELSIQNRMGIFNDGRLFTASQADFSSLFAVSVQGQQYDVNYYSFDPNSGGGTPEPFTPPTTSGPEPFTPPITSGPKKNLVIIDEPITDEPIQATPIKEESKSEVLKYISWAGAAFTLYAIYEKVFSSKN